MLEISLDIFFFLVFICFVSMVYGHIQWKNYDGRYLKPRTREFYKYSWDVYIPVPQQHSLRDSPTFDIYVRKFSSTREKTSNHLWLISGGPGSSTSGIERALSVQLTDTTIYIMDNRGLGHSHELCHHSEIQNCITNPKQCYESANYSPKVISIHQTAKDYNYISQMILDEAGGGQIFMYGSSYGATLAYIAFKYKPNLYSGLLLESFMPEFRLYSSVDIRKHVVDSCFRSETCHSAFGSLLTRSEAEDLMKTISKKETRNECKAAIEFMAGSREGSVNSLISSFTRFAFYSKTKLRAAFLPLLYGIAYCPDVEKFNTLLSEFQGAYQKHIEESSNTIYDSKTSMLLSPSSTEMHCSTGSQTNHFFGNHIRFSEFSQSPGNSFKKCHEVGYLDVANWADVCGMVSGWKEEYRPYLYQTSNPVVSRKYLENSPTRIVIVTGKLDTQTPYDLAQWEFDRLPMREKYIFAADHAGHGLIDEWEVPGLNLNLMLSFTMTGTESYRKRIEAVIEEHNGNADRIWNNWDNNSFQKSGNVWDLSVKVRQYSWWIFGRALGGCLLIPLVTLLLLDIERDDPEKTLL